MTSRSNRRITNSQATTRFTISIDTETDGRIIAEVPQLPGVMVYGNTEEEAVRKVKDLANQIIRDMRRHGELPFRSVRRRAVIGGYISKEPNEVARNVKRRILHK